MPNEKVFVDSSTVRAIKYDGKTKTLRITYVTNKMYDYANVPRHVFDMMLEVDSIGKFVNEYIKGHYPYKLVNENE